MHSPSNLGIAQYGPLSQTMMMQMRTPQTESRLPSVGTTIFTVMSALASKHNAVNLGQGFPDFQCDPALTHKVVEAMESGHNQYPPMSGLQLLRQSIATKILSLYNREYSADTEVTVTAGATQAIFTAILSITLPGDEVIVLEPCYDSYVPNIELAGAIPVRVPLGDNDRRKSFRPNLEAIAAAITPKTRALLINSPHNPTGTVWTESEMLQLQEILAPTDVVLISDEVYEHMVFDGAKHNSASSYPGLAARSFVISSFGKTFHVTGWKVGYVAAPSTLTAEFRKVHQFNVFTVNTPMQHGLAAYLSDPRPYLELPNFYQRKRDHFLAGLRQTGFKSIAAEGTYFQCVDYSDLAIEERNLSDSEFCQWLTTEIGVAAIPLSAFYGSSLDQHLIRFCFAKTAETLDTALERLRRL